MRSRYVELCRARPLLGTLVEITARSDKVERSAEAIDRAFAEISIVERCMSFHDAISDLSRINGQAFAGPVAVNERTFAVLEQAREMHERSNGLFDPTIAPELERAGFLPGLSNLPTRNEVSFADVELLDRNRVKFRRPDVRLDLGGVAKGYAVDRAVSILLDAGVASGLVNAGGDLRAFGVDQFFVEVRDPSYPGETVAHFPIRNLALATSGHYFADRIAGRAVVGPFVHPRTREFQVNLLSVTVANVSAMTADALTKVVMLDPSGSARLLPRWGAAALIIDLKNSVYCSPSWYETVQAAA